MGKPLGVDPQKLRKLAVDLWFAIERMKPGNPARGLPPALPDVPDDGDAATGSGVPRRPAPAGGGAAAAEPEHEG